MNWTRFSLYLLTLALAAFAALGDGPRTAAEQPQPADSASQAASGASQPAMPPAANRPVDFVRDIRPIFQRSCYACHGPEKHKSGYRLDVRSVAMKGGDAYAPNIVPGKGAESSLVRFVAGVDDDVKMPPSGKRLPAEDVGLLRAWVDQGAAWPDSVAGNAGDPTDWWSLKPLVRPKLPAPVATAATTSANDSPVSNASARNPSAPSTNPIDLFVRQTLAEKGFPSAPEADRRTLLRRLYFDLIGLPPTPDEVEDFVADRDPRAYERRVDELLASPRYGERWARDWMDAAHFAETHGNDEDKVRENAWPYRDYLIASFNADKRYDRFIQEQVAGDVLFPDDGAASTVALGFLAAGPWDESSMMGVKEDTLDRQISRYIDRDDMLCTVMNNVCSVTVQCARCHDHKFDPISQADYYSLQAVFAGVNRANRAYDADPKVRHHRADLLAQKEKLEHGGPDVEAELAGSAAQEAVAAWERDLQSRRANWTVVTPAGVNTTDGTTLKIQPDGSVLASGPRPDVENYALTAKMPLPEISAIRVEVLPDASLPKGGPGRMDNGDFTLSEVDLFAGVDDHGAPLKLDSAAADFCSSSGTIAATINDSDTTGWSIAPRVGKPHWAIFDLRSKFAAAKDSPITLVLKQTHGKGQSIGHFRFLVTDSPPPVSLEHLPHDIETIIKVRADRRSPQQRVSLAKFVRRAALLHDLALLPPQSVIFAATHDFDPDGSFRPAKDPYPVFVLNRGDIKQPKAKAEPGALSCIAGLDPRFKIADPHDEGQRRAALAHWLTDSRNPLTWRSIVNRVWQHHFGHGIVATPNDFGRMGALPTHPDLLNWLAVEFRDGGQSIKKLNRLIVTSETYRQSSRIADIGPSAASAVAADGDNRYLWRMNRTRLEAECVRDAVLSASGRLDLRMGGPSDRQFAMHRGIHVTPVVEYSKFDLSSDAGRRRSIYRFLFRTLPDPFMETLDCPSGDEIMGQRTSSVTVQQALALWNDAFIARHCEYLAARVEKMGQTTSDRVGAVIRLLYSRPPRAEELSELVPYADKYGMANLCRVLLNSNEFLFVN